MGLASLILGGLGLGMMFLTLLAKISFGSIPTICVIIGLILGIMDMKKEKNKQAMTGIILCCIYILIFIIIAIRSVVMIKSVLP